MSHKTKCNKKQYHASFCFRTLHLSHSKCIKYFQCPPSFYFCKKAFIKITHFRWPMLFVFCKVFILWFRCLAKLQCTSVDIKPSIFGCQGCRNQFIILGRKRKTNLSAFLNKLNMYFIHQSLYIKIYIPIHSTVC